MRLALLLIASVLLAACSAGGSGNPAPTTTSLAETGTPAAAGPTATERAPVPSEPEPTTQSSAAACPVNDEAFCTFARRLDEAIGRGDVGGIVAVSVPSSTTCSGLEQLGPCFGLDEGAVIEGHLVGIDASDGILYLAAEDYLELISQIEDAAAAEDEYGDGRWRLVAVIDDRADTKVLVTTTIGADPIYQQSEPERRVFLIRTELVPDEGWRIRMVLTTVFVEQNLTGTNPDGSPYAAWAAWGGG